MIDAPFDRIIRNLDWCIWVTVANIAVNGAILVLLAKSTPRSTA